MLRPPWPYRNRFRGLCDELISSGDRAIYSLSLQIESSDHPYPRTWEEGRVVKKIAILPTLLTLGNGVCGFAAIAYAARINSHVIDQGDNWYFALSSWLILAAMVFDALDGYAARLSKTASEFGGQLDSLCDAISFGVAPGFLLLRLGQPWAGADTPVIVPKAIAVIAALYVACAVLRLARFNVENSPDPASHKRFKGLPSPAAAGCVASLALLRAELLGASVGLNDAAIHSFVSVWAPLGTLVVALLMVSRLPYPHLTKQLLRGRHNFRFVVQVVLLVFLIALTREIAIFVLFWGYALQVPIRYALFRRTRATSLPAPNPGLDDAITHSP
jgi:CDP-diacylglycerol--serine O-phosphatidyltransferase